MKGMQRISCFLLSLAVFLTATVYVEKVYADGSFEEQISSFPESYKTSLRALHSIYPNWKFYADYIDITLDKAAELETVRKVTDDKSVSWRSMDKGSYDWGSGEWVTTEKGRWHYASREVTLTVT